MTNLKWEAAKEISWNLLGFTLQVQRNKKKSRRMKKNAAEFVPRGCRAFVILPEK